MSDDSLVPGRISPTADPEGNYRRNNRSSSGRTVLIMTFLLLFLVVGLVALGWLIWQQQQSMTLMSEQLTEAHEQVTNLSNQLTDTESNMTATVQDADQQIATNESEIRKLWDLSNKRNKGWIQTNQANIATNQVELEATRRTLNQIETDLNTSLASVVAQQRDLTDKINVLTRQTSQLSDTVKRQVEQNTQSIQAIDVSRQQNNQRLLDTSRRVSNIESRLNAVESRPGL
ncbi:MAG: hypothetical protein OXG15_13325 [Gammaproteobacteria bacterium]|nr:hypothetical protein [Gammaproteobacteria bacterium]